MAAPNLDPRFNPQQSHQQQHQHQQQQQQQQPAQPSFYPPPPSSRSAQSGQGAANRQPKSPSEYSQSNPNVYPSNQYPPPPQGYFPQQDGYQSPGLNNQAPDPRVPRQANSQYAPSPQPSFSNQVAPFAGEKQQANYPTSNYGSSYPFGSGPIPQHDYVPDYQYMQPQYKPDRHGDNDRDTSESRSSNEERGKRHKRRPSRTEDFKSSRNPLNKLSDEQRNLGASILGGAGGALVGHKLGGKLGATVGILVGAIGATKLEEKRERQKRREEEEGWKDYYAIEQRPAMSRQVSSSSYKKKERSPPRSHSSDDSRERSKDRRRW